MESKLACEIVKDLLPLYVDGIVSDVSKTSIESHLEHCRDCNEIYRDMAFHLEEEAPPAEVSDVKRFLRKTKKMYLLYGFGALSFLAIFVCLIVDLAVNKKITWSLIAGSSCLFADAFLYVLCYGKKKKGCAAMSVISIGTFVLLWVIQMSRYYLMEAGTVWIFRYGLPILLLWLLILWIPVLGRTFLKWNIWDCAALLMLLSIAGSYVTKVITGDYIWGDAVPMREFISNGLGEAAAAVIFAAIGWFRKRRK